MSVLLFILSIVLICIAHILRIYRWSLFIKIYEKPSFKVLTQALCGGYLLNNIVPYKLGDLFRVYFAGRKMKNKYALSFASVIMDRYLDVLFIGFVFLLFYFFRIGGREIGNSVLFYIRFSLFLLIIPCFIYIFKNFFKNLLLNCAKIFNLKIETALLTFIWAGISNFKDLFLRINKIKLLFITLGMWGLYFSSYYYYVKFLNSINVEISFINIFEMFFAQHNITETFNWALCNSSIIILQLFYLILPIFILLVFSFLLKNKKKIIKEDDTFIYLLPYMDSGDKLNFLENYFSNSKTKEYINNYLKINREISIVRDYSKGSKASTILAIKDGQLFWRKYTLEVDVDKLYQQILWLEKYKDILPLSNILFKEKSSIYCYYDMQYDSEAVEFFEYIHTNTGQKSWDILLQVINKLNKVLYSQAHTNADSETIAKYIDTKVTKNIEILKQSSVFKKLLQYDKLLINGQEYNNLSHYYKFLDKNYLTNIFKNDFYCPIHGDLTIENIIALRSKLTQDSFYLIDPNPDNIHNSPNLDLAKILQSIHGGYEFLVAVKEVSLNGNKVTFASKKSSAYEYLYSKLSQYLRDNFSPEQVRSIYFHEIIHWLRLLPYRIRKNEKNAIICFAQLVILLEELEEVFIKKDGLLNE